MTSNQQHHNVSDLVGGYPMPVDPGSQLDRMYRRREFVLCRTFGHAWDSIPVTEPDPDGPQFWLRCTRCTTMRRDVVDRRYGTLIRRKYDYPDDYQLKGEDVPTRDDFRLRLLTLAEDMADRRAKRRQAS